jgi:hypothetical protein
MKKTYLDSINNTSEEEIFYYHKIKGLLHEYCPSLMQYDILLGTIFTNIHAI